MALATIEVLMTAGVYDWERAQMRSDLLVNENWFSHKTNSPRIFATTYDLFSIALTLIWGLLYFELL